VGAVFDRCGLGRAEVELRRIANALGATYAAFRAPLGAVHGVFAPHHILVSEGRIYVLDLESSRTGYAYEDLALFRAYYDFRLPWRTALASARLPVAEQMRAFRAGYARHAPACDEPDELMLRLARLHALIGIALSWQHADRPHAAKSLLRWRWWRRCFLAAWAEELPVLRRAIRR
jgi:hypothetical protein